MKKKWNKIVEEILKMDSDMSKLSDSELRHKTDEFKLRLKEGTSLDSLLPEAFAVVREAAFRVVGMKPYPVQIMGGIAIHEGNIAEMATGEGKTLVSTMPAYLNALVGKGVHIVTVNDYLAKRDAEWMGKIHEFLGLSVGYILNACPCGYYPMDKCRCTSRQILRYQNRISGPILDRMDLFVRCEEIGYDILTASSKEEASSSIQKRVSAAWVIQKERFAESSTIFNGRMTKSEVEQYCQLDAEGQRLMKKAYSAFSLTGRSYFKILKTARTIADLEQSPDIKARHLEEALYFRQKEKGNLNER